MEDHRTAERTVPAEEFVSDPARYVDSPDDTPLVITRDGKAVWVLIGAEEYERLVGGRERSPAAEIEDHSELIAALEQTLADLPDVEATNYPVVRF